MFPKLLIIEDNEQDQKIIRRYLTKAGYEDIRIADSGEKGIEEALSDQPDIILLDTLLPGIDGFETCRQIKQEKRIPTKVIIMTGRIDAVDTQKAKQAGADDYCVKTLDCLAIKDSLSRFVESGPRTAAEEKKRVVSGKDVPLDIQDSQWTLEKTKIAIKTLYKELERKNEELKELDRLKSEFVAVVSHELRTPLTIIKGVLSQILDGIYGVVTEVQRQKLSMALRNAEGLHRIINDILDLSRLEAKEVKLEKKTFDIVQMGKEVHAAFSNLAIEKGLVFKLNFSKEKIEIEADHDRINQVFTNLVGNALKFTEKGSIEISIIETPHMVECSVSDTGRGIAQEDLPKVFGRFQQFGRATGTHPEGTGLGLSICKMIVELHKGQIGVESHLGKGTKFSFKIPKRGIVG